MDAITSTWFECAVKYERTNEDGLKKPVTETYVVEALSFTEAEAMIIREMTPFASGGLEVKKINPMSVKEIFFSHKEADDKWYKCKLTFITIDEKTEKEKRSSSTFIVQANSLSTALGYMTAEMSNTMIDYVASNISETKIMDVFRK